jgi:hypothetical protein
VLSDKPDHQEANPNGIAIRLRIRPKRGTPVLEPYRDWLAMLKPDASPKSPISIFIGYAQNNREVRSRHASSGSLAIDNSVAERRMTRIAIGRNNRSVTARENVGKSTAMLFSRVSSRERHRFDPFADLRIVLERLPNLLKE